MAFTISSKCMECQSQLVPAALSVSITCLLPVHLQRCRPRSHPHPPPHPDHCPSSLPGTRAMPYSSGRVQRGRGRRHPGGRGRQGQGPGVPDAEAEGRGARARAGRAGASCLSVCGRTCTRAARCGSLGKALGIRTFLSGAACVCVGGGDAGGRGTSPVSMEAARAACLAGRRRRRCVSLPALPPCCQLWNTIGSRLAVAACPQLVPCLHCLYCLCLSSRLELWLPYALACPDGPRAPAPLPPAHATPSPHPRPHPRAPACTMAGQWRQRERCGAVSGGWVGGWGGRAGGWAEGGVLAG